MTDTRAVLRRVYPEKMVASVETIRRGNHKQTTVATFSDGWQVVVQRSDRPAALQTEIALARAIAERTSVPVPVVLDSGTLEGTGYAIIELARGQDLHERFAALSLDQQRAITRTFGRTLATLHESFDFGAYGPVEADDGGLHATGSTDWPTWFASYARAGTDALPDAFGDLRDSIRGTIETADLPETPPSALYPWDLRPGNALVADGTVTAILDWGGPLAADPALSVAKTEHVVAAWYVADADDAQPLRTAFREGYRSIRPLPDVPCAYRLVAVVRSAVDSRGEVTRPGYPERTGEAAVAFHRERLADLL